MVELAASQSEVATQLKDRRTARRYDLSLPILVHATSEKETASRTGKTRDTRSRNGDQKVGVAAVFEMHEIVRNEAAIA